MNIFGKFRIRRCCKIVDWNHLVKFNAKQARERNSWHGTSLEHSSLRVFIYRVLYIYIWVKWTEMHPWLENADLYQIMHPMHQKMLHHRSSIHDSWYSQWVDGVSLEPLGRHRGEVVVGLHVPLLRRALVPGARVRTAAWHPGATRVAQREVALRLRQPERWSHYHAPCIFW